MLPVGILKGSAKNERKITTKINAQQIDATLGVLPITELLTHNQHFGGNDLNAINNGINHDPTRYARSPQLTVANSRLYATWSETSLTGAQPDSLVRIAVYSGNDSSPSWTFVDGNGVHRSNPSSLVNGDAIPVNSTPQLTAFFSKLYLIWSEVVVGQPQSPTQIRIAVGQ